MAKINFDTSKRLDITCRRGDSFELELTLKDSSGIPINLGGTTLSTFEMVITSPLSGGSLVPSPGVLASTTGMEESTLAHIEIKVDVTDVGATTTADTTDAAYEAETAASGVVKFSMSKTDMKFLRTSHEPYEIAAHHVYDIKYINPNTTIDSEFEGKTILFGNFILKGDSSRTLR
mgnify:FL=1|tara:strand:+ start:3573 stop:4100 length:528 start_codon:yes stop_codon:yes gene_type:complete